MSSFAIRGCDTRNSAKVSARTFVYRDTHKWFARALVPLVLVCSCVSYFYLLFEMYLPDSAFSHFSLLARSRIHARTFHCFCLPHTNIFIVLLQRVDGIVKVFFPPFLFSFNILVLFAFSHVCFSFIKIMSQKSKQTKATNFTLLASHLFRYLT